MLLNVKRTMTKILDEGETKETGQLNVSLDSFLHKPSSWKQMSGSKGDHAVCIRGHAGRVSSLRRGVVMAPCLHQERSSQGTHAIGT